MICEAWRTLSVSTSTDHLPALDGRIDAQAAGDGADGAKLAGGHTGRAGLAVVAGAGRVETACSMASEFSALKPWPR
jgi:hypothetical protein